ncbi:MAG: glycosyltransferase [Paludibacter sp.]|jgi:glycosyltransferase involved in cell wall biosynthesis|nr:glycosyltransferase [Paludibacter sp.]
MLKLSYILPCYNVEKYIGECLQSIYNQSIDEEDFEVICVNDCSPDDTRRIITDWQCLHKNLILIDHTANKMQGGARNTGLRAARGKYIWFVDSDDFIKPDCVKNLLQKLDEHDLDFIRFDFDIVDEHGNFLERDTNDFPEKEIREGKNVFQIMKNDFHKGWGKMTCYVWTRIIKRSFLTDNHIAFFENYYGEDYTFGLRCFAFAKKFMYLKQAKIYYRQHQNSYMKLYFKPENKGLWYASQYKNVVELYKVWNSMEDEYLRQLFKKNMMNHLNDERDNFKFLLNFNNRDRKLFFQHLDKIPDLYLIFPYISRYTKFAITQQRAMTIFYNVNKFSGIFDVLIFFINIRRKIYKKCKI